MKILLLIIMFITSFIDGANNGPDLNPKALQRNLEKITGCSDFHKEELTIPNSDSYGSIQGKFFRVSCSSSNYIIYAGRVNSCRAGGCSIVKSENEYEFFDYFIIYNSDLTVEQVTVYNYEATHGHEITSKNWLKQFIGYTNGKKLDPGKEIDAISGATISVNAITEDVKEKTAMLSNLNH